MVNINMKTAEVHWKLNSYCEFDCIYCPSKYRGGELDKTLDQYLHVVDQLQTTRYNHCDSINWFLGGGEPLHFPNLNLLLQKIKSKNSYVRLDTSGGDNWFSIMEILNYVDHFRITHHYWQNPTVLDYIIDMCNENQKKLNVIVPLMAGKIKESREKVAELVSLGINANEITLSADQGGYWQGYSKKDINLINYLPEDYVEPDKEPVAPSNNYIDLSKLDGSPVHTGKPCYAGIDWINIGYKGFASASNCGGRPIGNVFDGEWQAPAEPFPCSMIQCRDRQDQSKIRVIQS
jgi:MoaA/NifB/PqqE/SkfB family radical SAM enzyme